MMTIKTLQRLPITFACGLLWIMCDAQQKDCNCVAHMAFVQSYMQKNHAAFKDNVTPKTRPAYLQFCKDIAHAIQADSCKTRCSVFIDRYLKFFKDHHIYIDQPLPVIDENDSAVMTAFKQSVAWKNTEMFELDEPAINMLRQKSLTEPEGIYTSFPFPGYTAAVVKNASQYKGVIMESSTRLWQRGQVKFVLTPAGGDKYSGVVWMKDHTKQQKEVHFTNGSLDELFFTKRTDRLQPATLFEFKKMNDSTCYLRINSFVGELYHDLDSFFKSHFTEITSTPFLVIDITNNGGGSDKCYQGLIDFIYTKPIASELLDLYVTPDNISVYKRELAKAIADSAAYGAESIVEMKGYINKMQRAKPFTFIPMDSKTISYTTRKKVFVFPKKVAIIYNRHTASSAESFILDALQSSKTITLGENSGGYTGYGNVFAVPVPDSDLTLGCTTTRYHWRRKFDSVGIPPMHALDFSGDWLNAVQSFFQNKKNP